MEVKYPAVTAQVASRIVDDQAVLVLADSGEVEILNEVGAVIWELIDGRRSSEEIGNQVGERFDVAPEQALEDTNEFLGKLVEAGAIQLLDHPVPEDG
jgi:hypothetical protein